MVLNSATLFSDTEPNLTKLQQLHSIFLLCKTAKTIVSIWRLHCIPCCCGTKVERSPQHSLFSAFSILIQFGLFWHQCFSSDYSSKVRLCSYLLLMNNVLSISNNKVMVSVLLRKFQFASFGTREVHKGPCLQVLFINLKYSYSLIVYIKKIN